MHKFVSAQPVIIALPREARHYYAMTDQQCEFVRRWIRQEVAKRDGVSHTAKVQNFATAAALDAATVQRLITGVTRKPNSRTMDRLRDVGLDLDRLLDHATQLMIWPCVMTHEAELDGLDPISEVHRALDAIAHLPSEIQLTCCADAVAAIIRHTAGQPGLDTATAFDAHLRLLGLRGLRARVAG